MEWAEVRQVYPNQWLVVESLDAFTTLEKRRQVTKLSVIEVCSGGSDAFARYRQIHQKDPEREIYFVHTSRETLEIYEQQWLGIRINDALHSKTQSSLHHD